MATTRTLLTWKAIAILTSAIFLLSCNKRASDLNENELLQLIGFNEPISVSVKLGSISTDQTLLPNSSEAALAALFLKAGILNVVPLTTSEPWWNYSVSGGTLNGSNFSVVVGKRAITSRTEEKNWSEGSVDFYAETIAYSIGLVGNFNSAANINPISSTLRLVAYKDPAIGKWQALNDSIRGTKFNQNDAATIRNQLSAIGVQLIPTLVEQVARAKGSAFEQIQVSLASNGIIAKSDSNSDVVVSKSRNLAYYAKPREFNSLSLKQATEYCSSINVSPYPGWRLPDSQELSNIVTKDKILDTPDGRIWAEIGKPANVGVVFVSATVSGNARDASGVWVQKALNIMTPSDLPALPETMENVTWSVLQLSTNGNSQWNGYILGSRLQDVGNASLAPMDSGSGKPALLRIICVTGLTVTSPR